MFLYNVFNQINKLTKKASGKLPEALITNMNLSDFKFLFSILPVQHIPHLYKYICN